MAMEAARVVAAVEGADGGKGRMQAVAAALVLPLHPNTPKQQWQKGGGGGATSGGRGEAAGPCQVTGNRNSSFSVNCAKVRRG